MRVMSEKMLESVGNGDGFSGCKQDTSREAEDAQLLRTVPAAM
jgi:hypothetical protein